MNGNNMKYKSLVLFSILLLLGQSARAEQIGSVDTVFKMFGPDHKIVVEAFDDPDVKNVTCYVSRAKTGGIKGGLGLAEESERPRAHAAAPGEKVCCAVAGGAYRTF